MTLNEFIKQNNLQPGDAVVAKKDNIGLLDHYLIYLGYHFGEHKFIANYFNGTKILSYSSLYDFSTKYSPTRIRRFIGNDIQRNAAISRALSMRDQNSYHLILNNCEHYANYVQLGSPYSQQTTLFGTSMAVTGLAVAASSKSVAGKGVGAVMAILGLLTLMTEIKD
jgi:hypothetical protein